MVVSSFLSPIMGISSMKSGSPVDAKFDFNDVIGLNSGAFEDDDPDDEGLLDDDDNDDECLLDDNPNDEGLVVKDDDVFADGVMRTYLCVDESNSTPGIVDDAVSTVNPDTSLISQPFAFLLVLSFLVLSHSLSFALFRGNGNLDS